MTKNSASAIGVGNVRSNAVVIKAMVVDVTIVAVQVTIAANSCGLVH